VLLTRRRAARRGDDRGAVAAVAAVFVGSGVALGICALVVDVGLIYAEHKQLQTGADAAAVEVARVCATSAVACGAPESGAAATAYAQVNVPDGEATAVVCGRGGGLSECPAPSDATCTGPAPEAGVYAEVHTSILTADGSTLLPPVFAQAVVDDYDGAAVTACARVTWGSPTAARGLALTTSTCDWKRMTRGGGALPSTEQAVALYTDTDPAACGRGGTGAGDPGGFRWVAGADSTCRTSTSTSTPLRATLPDERPNGCLEVLESLIATPGQAVAVPIFAKVTDAGDGGFAYAVQGVAAFVVTGWQLPDSVVPSPNLSSCGAGVSTCVYGFFTRAVVPGGGTVGGPDLGAQITALIG